MDFVFTWLDIFLIIVPLAAGFASFVYKMVAGEGGISFECARACCAFFFWGGGGGEQKHGAEFPLPPNPRRPPPA